MNKLILFLITLVISTGASAAPLSLQTSNKYLEMLQLKENFNEAMDIMVSPLVDGILNRLYTSLSAKGVQPEKINRAIEAMHPYLIDTKNAVINNLDSVMPFDRMAAEVYHPVFSESFTDEELSELIEFLSTPLGKKYTEQSLTMMQKSSKLLQQKFGPAIESLFSEEYASRKEEARKSIMEILESANK